MIKSRLSTALITIALMLAALLLLYLIPGWADTGNGFLHDKLLLLRYRLKGSEKISPKLSLIAIDDKTYETFSSSEQDWYYQGRLLTVELLQLTKILKPSSLAIDLLFESPGDPETDRNLVELSTDRNIYFPLSCFFSDRKGVMTSERERIVNQLLWHPVVEKSGDPAEPQFFHTPFPALAIAARGVGHVNLDAPGRYIYLLYQYAGGYIPSLTFRQVCDYFKVPQERIVIRFGSSILLKEAELSYGIKKDISIPIDRQGRLRLNYPGPWEDSFYIFPLQNLLSNMEEKEALWMLKDSLENNLLIAADVSSRGKDFIPTLFSNSYPAAGIHLTTANMILTENFLRQGALPWIIFYFCVLFILLIGISRLKQPGPFIAASAALLLVLLAIHITALLLLKTLLPAAETLAVFFPVFFLHLARIYGKERKAALRTKDLSRDVVHEIKNTSSGIGFLLTRLLQRDSLDEEARHKLALIKEEIQRLRSFSSKHLHIDALHNRAPLEKSTLLLLPLIRQIVDEVEIGAAERNITIRLAIPEEVTIQGDPVYLGILFTNLIENAVKYTFSHTEITVEAMQNSHTRVMVIDQGPGIDAEKKRESLAAWNISAPGRFSSHGIGLLLCRRIVELHNGSITFNSHQGEGTQITVLLPG